MNTQKGSSTKQLSEPPSTLDQKSNPRNRKRNGSGRGNKNLTVSKLDNRNRRQCALSRLGIDDLSQLENVPRVSHLLREAEDGLAQVLDALRASSDPDAQAFVARHDAISPSDRKEVTWEEIAVAAGIGSLRLLEISVSSLIRQQATIAQIVSASSHPLVVKKSVQMALTEKGWRDREMMLNARGFLPVAHGASINNMIQFGVGIPGSEGPEETGDLPQMEDDLKSIHGLLLGSGKDVK